MKNAYRAYGLTFTSSVAIEALSACRLTSAVPDVHFETGALPGWALQALALDNRRLPVSRSDTTGQESVFTLTEYGAGRFLQLAYADGTRFLVDEDAARIWGEPGPGLSNDDLFVYLLGPIMGFVLRKRGRAPLHASAVALGEEAVALVGEPGAGKSTTAAALTLRGWPVLSEDVCALEEHDGRICVLPGYPRICLWPDSVKLLFSAPDALPPIVPRGWEKRYLALDGSPGLFATEPRPLSAIYLLSPRSDDPGAPRIEPLSQKDAFLNLVLNTYMNWLLDRRQRAVEFDAIGKLLSLVPCFEITPSTNPDGLGELASLIESHALSSAARLSSVVSRAFCGR